MHANANGKGNQTGFSLLELIIVIAIAMLLVTIGVTYTRSGQSAARTTAAATSLRSAILLRSLDARRLRAGAPPDAFNPLGTPRLELNIAQPQTWGPIAQASVQGAAWNYTAQQTTMTALPTGWSAGTTQCMPQIAAVGGPPPVANPNPTNRLVFDYQANLYDPNQPDNAATTIVVYICTSQGSVIAATAPQGSNAQAVQFWRADANSSWTQLN